jgi:hypothetical protein
MRVTAPAARRICRTPADARQAGLDGVGADPDEKPSPAITERGIAILAQHANVAEDPGPGRADDRALLTAHAAALGFLEMCAIDLE